MRRTPRVTLLLVVVFPVALLADAALDYARNGWRPYLVDRLPLVGLFLAAAAGLARRATWARTLARVIALPVALVLLIATGQLTLDGLRATNPAFSWYEWLTAVWMPAVSAAALLGAFVALREDASLNGEAPRGIAPGTSRAIAVAVAAEVALMALILVVGLESADHVWYKAVLLEYAHLPGIYVLSAMGLCCGFFNDLVLTDAPWGHLGPLTAVGVPMLAAANALGLVLLALALRAGWRMVGPTPERNTQRPAT